MTPEQLAEAVRAALAHAVADGAFPLDPADVPAQVHLERPRQREHGDWSTNVAMHLAKKAGVAPRALADELAGRLAQTPGVAAVEVAGPGFLNIRLDAAAAGELARTVAVVAQTAFLFDDTVRGNVTLGADVSDEEVWAALRAAQAEGFVAALPDGLDARLGERGTSLSGGQRQRISLARALVRHPRLLILDDATSAVDPEVEARILEALRSGDPGGTGSTLVVVAYRKATIGLADEVVHLEDGRIAGRGTHAELLERSPSYARLVNAYEEHAAHAEALADELVEETS